MTHLPFALPDVGEEEIRAVSEALRSGWVTTGPMVRQFEADFTAFLGGDDLQSLSVNSATSGLHLALEACGIGPGDEVITTPYTFTATAEVIRYLGAHPVLVDVDPRSRNIDPTGVVSAITDRTKAILPVHIGGLAADMTAILECAKRHGLRVVEDAAHALPTTHNGQLIGTLTSDVTVFSFYATKTITTGEGGMVVTNDSALAKRMRTMRLHGIDRDAFDRYTSDKPAWYYEVVAPGYKYNMTDIAAAMGIEQLKKAWRFQQRREWIATQYDQAFAQLPVRLPLHAPDGDTHAWHLYVVDLLPEAGMDRDTFIQRMSELGIGCSVHFIPLYRHPYWRDTYNLKPSDYPFAEEAFSQAVSLPIYTRMSDTDVQRVISAVCSLLA